MKENLCTIYSAVNFESLPHQRFNGKTIGKNVLLVKLVKNLQPSNVVWTR